MYPSPVERNVKELELKVFDPDPSHVGRNIVTLDKVTKDALGVTSGDIIEIEGTKKTAAVIWPARTEDEGKSIIRMDNFIRHNAGVGLGEKVRIRKSEVKEAKKVILAPTQDVRIIASGYDRILKKNFIGRPLVRGDSVWISVFGSGFVYTVVDTTPRGIVKVNDFTQFVLKEQPVKESVERVPRVAYEDIGGLQEQVQKVREMIELPMRHPELFRRLGIQPPKGVLLYGPPGCGKTLLAKAVANETEAHFLPVQAPSLMSKFVGEAEERIRQVFKEAEDNAPSIIFFDEIDAIAPKRDEVIGEVERRVVAQLLSSMDGMEARGNVIVIAATNRVNSIDEALRRPGRFDREIEFPVPGKNERKQILQIHTRGMPIHPPFDAQFLLSALEKNRDDVLSKSTREKMAGLLKKNSKEKEIWDALSEKEKSELKELLLTKLLEDFADITHGFVGADLSALTKESAMKALRRYLPKINLDEDTIPQEVLESLEVNKKDFQDALRDVQPSALREVTIEVPNVKWNEVGALEDAKTELRQAVEWPLKNPGAFKRLGIKPPRGVLLYGPPGCGKTLLAKAVATESGANFISVKGPELISMWVGESLPFDEELLVFDGKAIFREKIGKIVEEQMNVQVVSFDLDGKAVFSPITGHIKHPLNGKLLEVVTQTGRRVRVTDKHSLFSFSDDGIVSIRTDELQPGKSVIAIPSRIPNVGEKDVLVNLAEFFSNQEGFMLHNVKDAVKELASKIGFGALSAGLNISRKSAYDVVPKNLPVNLKAFVRLAGGHGVSLDWSQCRVSIRGGRSSLPCLWLLDADFWLLAGLWVAEGEYNNGCLRLSAMNPEIRSEIFRVLNKWGVSVSANEKSIVANSFVLQRIFSDVLGLHTGAFEKRAPVVLWLSDASSVRAFLKGYFSGDGSISGNDHRFVIESSTVSQALANDLLYLFLKIGIVATHREKKEWNGSVSHCIRLMGVDNFSRFLEIGFIDSKRDQKIGSYIRQKAWSRSNTLPITEKIQNVLTQAFGSYPKNQSVGIRKLGEALAQVDASREQFGSFWKLLEMDVFWDKVVEIREIDYSGFVYDVSVEPCQNFIGGFGGIYCHNSEKGVRSIFKKARQVSPCIVFFDEIDSIASHRGGHGDSGVGDRLVNQLLTELDGIEDLKDVVFIAATNRPDLIDPALIRPGRVDKMIRVNAPDEKGRTAIMKVLLKRVPLAPDVVFDELIKQTNGFSGADLDGLIREAALIALQESNLEAHHVEKKHFDAAFKKVLPSISTETEDAYDEFKEKVHEYKPSYIE